MKHSFTIHFFVQVFAFIAFSSAQITWIKRPDPVLTHGPMGAWDSLYIQHSSVVFDGTKYHMYYSAQSAVTGHMSIGHATSDDGISWEKDLLNNPVLEKGPTGSWDADYVLNAAVLYDGSTFHMWYTGARPTNTNIRIGYAWSSNGINWQKYNDPATTNPLYAESDPVLIPGSSGRWDDLSVEVPYVLLEGNSYIMWYRGINTDFTDGIGRATSTDGITWNKDTGNNPVLRSGSNISWEDEFIRLGSVIFDGTKYHLFYYAGEFYMHFRIGYAWSSDGLNWTKYNDPETDHPLFAQSDPVLPWGLEGSWDDTQVLAPWVIIDTDTFKMWYTGVDNVNTPGVVSGIGYATASIVNALEEIDSRRFPDGFVLNQNYPNPFNSTTKIEFSVPRREFVTLKVYNILGEEVVTLVSEKLTAGSYKYDWDASNLASGVYLYKLQAGVFQQINKMILLR